MGLHSWRTRDDPGFGLLSTGAINKKCDVRVGKDLAIIRFYTVHFTDRKTEVY